MGNIKAVLLYFGERVVGDKMRILIKPKDAAEILDVTVSTIYRWFEEGILQPWKLGRTLRTTLEDIAFLGQPTGGIPKTREFFLNNVEALYSAYFLKHPKRKNLQTDEERISIWKKYAEEYIAPCGVC